jgi:hypothetical protein
MHGLSYVMAGHGLKLLRQAGRLNFTCCCGAGTASVVHKHPLARVALMAYLLMLHVAALMLAV